uniref:Protein Vpu n=1 Tax=Human immunodeficiency virus type 1 TaxID=11676 RepID=A0A6B9SJ45_HV1|nr:vpu protein [Human immunodeficiency virus 1]
MNSLEISAIVALVIAFILAIVVWTIVFIECKRVRREKAIDQLLDRIREREEDSGNESDGDKEELMEMGYHAPWVNDDI